MKIIDRIQKAQEEGRPLFSFEYFSPKTAQGMVNLQDRIERMCYLGPAFIDITWGAGGSRPAATLEVVSNAQKVYGVETCMHLICTNNPTDKIDKALNEARACGNQNILALRGDPPHGQSEWTACEGGLNYASDLIRYIRKTHGDYFGIGVAGYPEKHPESASMEEDLKYLKEKVDAGADFIVTQLFFDVPLFLDWVQKCRDYGITCPIIPGVMPIQAYASFKKNTVDTSVPQWILDGIEPIKNDDQAVRAFGVEVGIKMTLDLLQAGVCGIHYYTFNLERSTRLILEGAGLVGKTEYYIKKKNMPWRSSFDERRKEESVRPIFWSNRAKSYISRTDNWDEFPNGRWGDSRSPAYGDLDRYGVYLKYTADEAIQHWGTPEQVQDVSNLFVKYCDGHLLTLPWSDQALALESGTIKDRLIDMNSLGYLTINSQPAVNGAKSDDKVFGWGPEGGYVYQKAYLEFFLSPEALEVLKQRVSKFPSITFMAINKAGDLHSNTGANGGKPNAVTWGVFPGREVVQPTIVELSSFDAWKDEAFTLWEQWSKCYPQDSKARELLSELGQNWYLINIVNNDYHEKDGIFELFKEDIDALRAQQAAAAAATAGNADDQTVQAVVDVSAKLKDVTVNGDAKTKEEFTTLSPCVESVAIAQAVAV
ncbi:methylenetetrahydrofolate reductase-domain-containing protein [Mortierella sp. GBAus27b]|nr:hypothetical protein BGX31_001271 [Mortierella sp. GBA43]KAI8363705.1 methylenetetrahydrofolate reductase-domain-containing protein [Mortierella sp. GBAus27b]